jgi:hypothetical protein
MTGISTQGFDAVLELSENTVSTHLLPQAESRLILWCSGNFTDIATDAGAASGNCPFQPATGSGTGSSADLNTDVPNGIHLHLNFSVNVSFTAPAAWRDLSPASFSGMLRITAQAGIDRSSATERCFILDFSGITGGRVETEDLTLESGWEPHRGAFRQWLEEHVFRSLRTLGSDDLSGLLCRDVDPSDPDPYVAADVDVAVTVDGAVRGLALLTTTLPGSAGAVEDYTTSVLSPGDDVALVLGNRLLLQAVIGQRIAENLAIPDTSTLDASDILDAEVSLDSVLTVSGFDPLRKEWFARFEFSVKGSEELHGFTGVELLEGRMVGLPGPYVEREPSPAESTATVGSETVSAAVSASAAVGETVAISDCTQMMRTALWRGMGIDTSDAALRRGKP